MSVEMERKRHELVEDLVSQTVQVLVQRGVSEAEASMMAHALANHLANHWGGQFTNFPMHFRWRLDNRDVEIYDRHHAGASYGQLAMDFKLSERHVRTVIATVRKRLTEQGRRGPPGQGDIFGASGPA